MPRESSRSSPMLSPQGVTWLGLIANILLALAKILIGLISRSHTILADGVHSGSDLITDVAVLAGLRAAQRPADTCHPYGHSRITTLVALFVGIGLLATAGWIGYHAVASLHEPHTLRHPTLPFLAAAISIPIKELLFQVTRWVGKKTDNMALLANAWHHRTDALTSIAATAGLAAVAFGGPAWAILDHVTALVISAFLVIAALRILRDSGDELIDRAPDAARMAAIEETVAGTPGVRNFHALRARKAGGWIEMDIHVQVDPDLTVGAGHDIARRVRRRVARSDDGVQEVIVHIEPDESPADAPRM